MSLNLKILVVLALALIEIFWFVYMFRWGKAAQKQIDGGEINEDEVKQPLLAMFFILYHFPFIVLLTSLNKNDEAKGVKVFILTFVLYALIFLTVAYYI